MSGRRRTGGVPTWLRSGDGAQRLRPNPALATIKSSFRVAAARIRKHGRIGPGGAGSKSSGRTPTGPDVGRMGSRKRAPRTGAGAEGQGQAGAGSREPSLALLPQTVRPALRPAVRRAGPHLRPGHRGPPSLAALGPFRIVINEIGVRSSWRTPGTWPRPGHRRESGTACRSPSCWLPSPA
jgi:hypothetical protein